MSDGDRARRALVVYLEIGLWSLPVVFALLSMGQRNLAALVMLPAIAIVLRLVCAVIEVDVDGVTMNARRPFGRDFEIAPSSVLMYPLYAEADGSRWLLLIRRRFGLFPVVLTIDGPGASIQQAVLRLGGRAVGVRLIEGSLVRRGDAIEQKGREYFGD